nr:SUN domain-containing protein 3-like [Columba livia]
MRKKFTIRETDNHPGNCWPFPGSQGHIFIKLCMPVIPRAVTMDHVSGTVFHGESISGAPKNFAVYDAQLLVCQLKTRNTGLPEDSLVAGGEPSLRHFCQCSRAREEKATHFFFSFQNELPGFVNYIRLQVQSNWGHLNYTCLYQFGVHGDPHKDGVDIPVSFSNKFH